MAEISFDPSRHVQFRQFPGLGGTFRAIKYFDREDEAHRYGQKVKMLFAQVEVLQQGMGDWAVWAVWVSPSDSFPTLPPVDE